MDRVVRDFDIAVEGRKPERVPVVLWSKGPFVPEYIGVGVDEYYASFEVAMRAQMALQDAYPETLLIPGIFPDIGPVVEASAFGCEIIQPEGQAPFAMHCITVDDIPRMRPIDPKKDGLMPRMLQGWQYLWENLDPEYIKRYGYLDGCASTFGPLETAAQVLGYEEFFVAMYQAPERLHALLDVVADSMILYVQAQEEINGKIKRVTVTDHVAGQISARHFSEFGVPYMKRVFGAFPDAVTVYHNEANIKHVLEATAGLGFKVFHMGLEVDGDYAKGVELARSALGKTCLMGNVQSQTPLLWGTEEDVYSECIRQLDAGAVDGAMLLSVRGGFAAGTPRGNIRAMIRAAEDWSRNNR